MTSRDSGHIEPPVPVTRRDTGGVKFTAELEPFGHKLNIFKLKALLAVQSFGYAFLSFVSVLFVRFTLRNCWSGYMVNGSKDTRSLEHS